MRDAGELSVSIHCDYLAFVSNACAIADLGIRLARNLRVDFLSCCVIARSIVVSRACGSANAVLIRRELYVSVGVRVC